MGIIRKIIHLDMDAFYASVELRERPELAGQPVAVGGQSRRGVLTTCNYEARRFGVRSAMPVFQALECCPHLVLLPVRFDLYRQESRRIHAILREVTPLVEPLSLDEAFLDVTGLAQPATEIARALRQQIRTQTGLPASAGIAPNKLLAKIASDWRKPDGQMTIPPERIADFMAELPVRKLWGVGPRSRERLAALGVETCGQLQRFELAELQRKFGSFGASLYRQCRGEDDRPVSSQRERKSLSNERTFAQNLPNRESCEPPLRKLLDELQADLAHHAEGQMISGMFVKVKFEDFRVTTAEARCEGPTWVQAQELLRTAWQRASRPVRLLGLGVRFRSATSEQLRLPFKGEDAS